MRRSPWLLKGGDPGEENLHIESRNGAERDPLAEKFRHDERRGSTDSASEVVLAPRKGLDVRKGALDSFSLPGPISR